MLKSQEPIRMSFYKNKPQYWCVHEGNLTRNYRSKIFVIHMSHMIS